MWGKNQYPLLTRGSAPGRPASPTVGLGGDRGGAAAAAVPPRLGAPRCRQLSGGAGPGRARARRAVCGAGVRGAGVRGEREGGQRRRGSERAGAAVRALRSRHRLAPRRGLKGSGAGSPQSRGGWRSEEPGASGEREGTGGPR